MQPSVTILWKANLLSLGLGAGRPLLSNYFVQRVVGGAVCANAGKSALQNCTQAADVSVWHGGVEVGVVEVG